jgi:transposase
MRTTQNGRTFEKPYRNWVGAALNFLGRGLRGLGWRRPLTFQGVLDSACRYTRLCDWGDERFHEPLRILVQSLEEEADLTPLGRLFMKVNLRHFAANRLLVRQYLKNHPETVEEPLPRPLIVVGLPRTGTTLLHNLLCQDEARRPILLWEALQPAPSIRGRGRDWRRTKARLVARLIDRWGAPQLRSVHPFHADGPEECTGLLMNTFVSPAFFLLGCIPSYLDWLRRRGRELLPWAYEQYRVELQVLLHQGRRAPWILKSPVHSFGLEALLTALPDACVVLTQRDLKQVVPSTCSLFALMQGLYSDRVDRRRLGSEIVKLIGDLQEGIRQAQDASPARIFSIEYRSLVSDPIVTVRTIYRHFDLPLENGTQQRMRDWMARNPKNKHGVHQYDLEQFGLSAQEMGAGPFPFRLEVQDGEGRGIPTLSDLN